jgi:hypothetical protein
VATPSSTTSESPSPQRLTVGFNRSHLKSRYLTCATPRPSARPSNKSFSADGRCCGEQRRLRRGGSRRGVTRDKFDGQLQTLRHEPIAITRAFAPGFARALLRTHHSDVKC